MQKIGPLKLLHLPNDPDENDASTRQVGPRGALERLTAEGLISVREEILFLSDLKKVGNADVVLRNILERAGALKPDVVLWHHVGNFPIDPAFISELKSRSQLKLLVYHEGDVFGKLSKPISRPMRVLLESADIVFVVGLGLNAELMRKNGARELVYLPHYFDVERFGAQWIPTASRKYSVSMIGNNIPKRIPGFYMPGGRNRARLARRLSIAHGSRFALYGRSWTRNSSAQGLLAFGEQTAALRNSWVNANWDHFADYPLYFSDRLPIALAAGVAHVTNYHPGYEFQFRACPGLYYAHTVDDIIAIVDWLLSRNPDDLGDEGRRERDWAFANLSADVIYRKALDFCFRKIVQSSSRSI